MKYLYVFQIFLIFTISNNCFSQTYSPIDYNKQYIDSLDTNEIVIRPNFEFGMFTPKNSFLKDNYKTNSMFYWGVGFQLNHPLSSSFYPYFLYNQVNYSIKTQVNSMLTDNTFEMNQFSSGFFYKIYKISRTIVNGKIGYSHSFINESIFNIHKQAYGFLFGIGLERRFWKKSKFYFEYTYNFQKIEKSYFRDFDNTKISFGFCF